MPKLKLTKQRSPCPVASTLEVVGDKWSLLVIRDLFAGKHYFVEFQRSPEKIATNILSSRLKQLEDFKLIVKFPSSYKANQWGYELTEKGKSLFPVLEVVANWGLDHIEDTVKHIKVPCP